ncbi:hypothetical protein ACFP2T_29215 [Plantactinospora solaniradicis]|uniref:Uncharacterized protein n=1 Tax=Plantactinospora solaniradicis TaxID=1723736 RepID=A0ABW1KG49_9ACTN
MHTPRVSRRQVLTFAGLTLGVGVIEFAGQPAPVAGAPAGQEPTLEPVGDQPVAVLSGDGAAPAACPRQLAVKVVRDAALPAGAQLTVTFDPRLFVPLSSAVVSLGGRIVAADSAIATDPATGAHTCTVTLADAVPATGDLVAVLATGRPLHYPRDLVRQPSAPTASLRRAGKPDTARRSLQPRRPSAFGGPATPWGIELDGGWGRQTWGENDRFCYYHPLRVTMHSVGPGRAPVPASFAVSVDPQLVREISVASVRLNDKPYKGKTRLTDTTRTDSLYRSSWLVPIRLAPEDVLDVELRVSTLTPSGALTTIKHPVVGLTALGADVAQRLTGKDAFTRADSVWQ